MIFSFFKGQVDDLVIERDIRILALTKKNQMLQRKLNRLPRTPYVAPMKNPEERKRKTKSSYAEPPATRSFGRWNPAPLPIKRVKKRDLRYRYRVCQFTYYD